MSALDAELWAHDGVEELLTEHVRHPHPFTSEEVATLMRAAYGLGYMAALRDEAPLTILEAGRRAETLRLTLPIE